MSSLEKQLKEKDELLKSDEMELQRKENEILQKLDELEDEKKKIDEKEEDILKKIDDMEENRNELINEEKKIMSRLKELKGKEEKIKDKILIIIEGKKTIEQGILDRTLLIKKLQEEWNSKES